MRRIMAGIILAGLICTTALAQPAPRIPNLGLPPGLGGPVPVPPPDRSTTLHKEVDRAIDNGVQYLLKQQAPDSTWDNDAGPTALATLTLLSCGVPHQSPELTKAIAYLKRANADDIQNATYTLGLRAGVYSLLPESTRKFALRSDLDWLIAARIQSGTHTGMYTYAKASEFSGGDFSNSQYGVLGVWYAQSSGLEIPLNYWQRVEEIWHKGQNADGGWGYDLNSATSYASMTAAGVATLYVTYDALHSAEEVELTMPHQNAPLEQGIRWLSTRYPIDGGVDMRDFPGRPPGLPAIPGAIAPRRYRLGAMDRLHYLLFGFERVGEASGLTRFGFHKWFDDGAMQLIDTQRADGSWNNGMGANVDTSYALLFLSRGRSPVAMQKLQFNGRWNNRSRDNATIVRWLTRQTERHTNWQIVPSDASASEFRQAPILYVASDRWLELNKDDLGRIKTFIDQGGLLLAVNEGAGTAFADSVAQLAKELYPAYEFRDLPPDHLIFHENFPVNNLPTAPKGLSNGVRELIVLLPDGDMSWKFQQGAGAANPAAAPSFGFVGNLYIYMNDRANPRFKGDDTWIDPDPAARDRREQTVARLKINANWNPEPLGWTRLANALHNNDGIKLTIREASANELSKKIPLVHLTATNRFELSASEHKALKSYLDGGGVLFFDAAGGSTEAQLSFEALLLKMYPNEKLKPLALGHPIYGGIKHATFRPCARERLAKSDLPRLRVLEMKGRVVVIDSAEDLSAGLVGYNVDGIVGYSPASAMEIARNILRWANSSK